MPYHLTAIKDDETVSINLVVQNNSSKHLAIRPKSRENRIQMDECSIIVPEGQCIEENITLSIKSDKAFKRKLFQVTGHLESRENLGVLSHFYLSNE